MENEQLEGVAEQGAQAGNMSRRAFLAKSAQGAAALGAATVAAYVAPVMTQLEVNEAYATSPRNGGRRGRGGGRGGRS